MALQPLGRCMGWEGGGKKSGDRETDPCPSQHVELTPGESSPLQCTLCCSSHCWEPQPQARSVPGLDSNPQHHSQCLEKGKHQHPRQEQGRT